MPTHVPLLEEEATLVLSLRDRRTIIFVSVEEEEVVVVPTHSPLLEEEEAAMPPHTLSGNMRKPHP